MRQFAIYMNSRQREALKVFIQIKTANKFSVNDSMLLEAFEGGFVGDFICLMVLDVISMKRFWDNKKIFKSFTCQKRFCLRFFIDFSKNFIPITFESYHKSLLSPSQCHVSTFIIYSEYSNMPSTATRNVYQSLNSHKILK